jgi:hypothetical protein
MIVRTDYYLVGTTAHYDDWETTGHSIDCKTTSSCNNIKVALGSECTSAKWENSFSGNLGFEGTLKLVTGSVGLEFRHSWGGETTICTSTSDSRCVSTPWSCCDLSECRDTILRLSLFSTPYLAWTQFHLSSHGCSIFHEPLRTLWPKLGIRNLFGH